MQFNKLIRDNIPSIVQRHGGIAVTHVAGDEEYRMKLREKLQEEVDEFLESENPEELADIMEVIFALADHLEVSRSALEELRAAKGAERGAFRERLILDETR
ncbi:MAG: nucleoside triphosphate pyrophosphohydrolase [bacterium]|nr:nucleoside triphosphate pyrophosphohydrolase [bacterium]